jgi:hypothetical protein
MRAVAGELGGALHEKKSCRFFSLILIFYLALFSVVLGGF